MVRPTSECVDQLCCWQSACQNASRLGSIKRTVQYTSHLFCDKVASL